MTRLRWLLPILLISGCNYTTRCKRYYLPKGFLGRFVIEYGKKGSREEHDKAGCIVYSISAAGKCVTPAAYTPGVGDPDQTFRYFEQVGPDSLQEIYLFRESSYLDDTAGNKFKKYVFIISAGYSDSLGEFADFYVDYGMNYRRHHFLY